MESLNAVVLRQRMLVAKLDASFNRIHYPKPLSAEDLQLTDALLTAANAITSNADEALKPVM